MRSRGGIKEARRNGPNDGSQRLRRYPSGKRNIQKRAHAKTDEHIRISRQYGKEYFDGARDYGYAGYRYDGRWVAITEDMIAHWSLKPGMRVLDVGCAKGRPSSCSRPAGS